MGKRESYGRNSLLDLWSKAGSQWSTWQPRADIYRCSGGLLVKLEIAGVAESDIAIELDGDTLVISGRRRDWSVEATTEFLSMEISYDRFKRSLRLPAAVDAARIETEYRDGMLLVRLPYGEGSAQ